MIRTNEELIKKLEQNIARLKQRVRNNPALRLDLRELQLRLQKATKTRSTGE